MKEFLFACVGFAVVFLLAFFYVVNSSRSRTLSSFLSRNNLSHLIEVFHAEIYSLEDLMLLDNKDYVTLGIKVGEKNRLLALLKKETVPATDVEKAKKVIKKVILGA
eukprot:Pompholyxophrys_punicea_v1_NODE_9_length_7618_cov_25.552288.p8 type:complete len:107 gc:universal NODE_9_length_7618_cov_25.552288:2017-1697(-)